VGPTPVCPWTAWLPRRWQPAYGTALLYEEMPRPLMRRSLRRCSRVLMCSSSARGQHQMWQCSRHYQLAIACPAGISAPPARASCSTSVCDGAVADASRSYVRTSRGYNWWRVLLALPRRESRVSAVQRRRSRMRAQPRQTCQARRGPLGPRPLPNPTEEETMDFDLAAADPTSALPPAFQRKRWRQLRRQPQAQGASLGAGRSGTQGSGSRADC